MIIHAAAIRLLLAAMKKIPNLALVVPWGWGTDYHYGGEVI
jgi:hypothetical protein